MLRKFPFVLIGLALAISGCGKISEKFSRIQGGYTRVDFRSNRAPLSAFTLGGGMMVYFVDVNDSSHSRAFGFADESAALSRSVVLPNGRYKVYTLGFGGVSGNVTGQTYCGYGNEGAEVILGGGAYTLNLTLSTSRCNFGTDTPFGLADADASGVNFDTVKIDFCSGSAVPCTATSASDHYVRFQLLGGQAQNGSFAEFVEDTLTTNCSDTASSMGSISSTLFRLPVGTSWLQPAIRMIVYGDSACVGAVSGTYNFTGGLYNYVNSASGSSYHVTFPASSSYYYLRVNQNF